MKLTVTDDKGATDSATKSVTVTAPAALAADSFGRTVATGWGAADTGGTWTVAGGATNFAVGSGVGTVKIATSAGPSAVLGGVSSSSTDLVVTMSSDKVGTGNGVYLYAVGRRTSGGDYRGRVRLTSSGGVAIAVSRVVSGAETMLGSELVLPGVTYAAGTKLTLRLQVQGTGTTTLRLKVWPTSGSEPADWQVVKTDTTAGLQTAGSVGLVTYLSGTATNGPVVASFDDLAVTSAG